MAAANGPDPAPSGGSRFSETVDSGDGVDAGDPGGVDAEDGEGIVADVGGADAVVADGVVPGAGDVDVDAGPDGGVTCGVGGMARVSAARGAAAVAGAASLTSVEGVAARADSRSD